MPNQLDIVDAQALQLSPEERALLADRLIASLFGDTEIEDAWAHEVERRVKEIESGRAQLVPAADAIARALVMIHDQPPAFMHETALVSEAALQDWNRPEEEAAWSRL